MNGGEEAQAEGSDVVARHIAAAPELLFPPEAPACLLGPALRGRNSGNSDAPPPRNPVLLQHAEQRRKSAENRIADAITAFAGSMPFVYAHVIWFSILIGLVQSGTPSGLLTMIVSLEAIFLTSFVMISQNRSEEIRQVLADSEWQKVQKEDEQNEQLLGIANQILALTQAISAAAAAATPSPIPPGPAGPGVTVQDAAPYRRPASS